MNPEQMRHLIEQQLFGNNGNQGSDNQQHGNDHQHDGNDNHDHQNNGDDYNGMYL